MKKGDGFNMGRVWKHINYSSRSKCKTLLTKNSGVSGKRLRIAGDVHYPLYIPCIKPFYQCLRTTSGRIQQDLVEVSIYGQFQRFGMQVSDTKCDILDAIFTGI